MTVISEPGPTSRQKERADRSRQILDERKVPMWGDARISLYVDDDEQVNVQTADDVARRALVLWAVVLRADGYDWEKSRNILTDNNLLSYLSPQEQAYMDDPEPDQDTSVGFVWRLESLWVMLWALERLPDLPWPSSMCDVPLLGKTMKEAEADPEFIKNARLLPTRTLLDAQDLSMKILWAIRDAYIKELCIPQDFDWRNEADTPVSLCPMVGVVEQRNHALNWLVNFMDPLNWDEVDTPT